MKTGIEVIINEVANTAASLATEKYPYIENPNDDLGIREYNQRMYDKREAFVNGYISGLHEQQKQNIL